jgi:hypothetical protein
MKKRAEEPGSSLGIAQERIPQNAADTDTAFGRVKERLRLAWLRIPDRVVYRLLQPLLIIFFAL